MAQPSTEDAWLEHGLVPGDVVGEKYVLREIVGEGGMGRVFRAEETVLARTVAVKLLRPGLASDPSMLRRFAEEARAAGSVRHPSSVAVIDHGVSEASGPFLVMEYLAGRTLHELITADGPPPLRRVVHVVDQILSVLGEAHANGVIHGDVTSANILVEDGGDAGERVKVIDFGLARSGAAATAGDQETSETVSGTPEYMAPEVIRGRAPIAASDLYAVGIVLFELLTGATPFACGSAAGVLERHLRDAVVPPSLRRPDRLIPSALDQIIARALAKDPADRFASAASFRAALADAIRGVGADALCRCPACGEPRPGETGTCRKCGMTVGSVDDGAATHDLLPPHPPTWIARGSRPADRAEHAPAGAREQALRGAVAVAIRRGDVDAMVESYLALARFLAAAFRVKAAIGELEEALDVVGAGGMTRGTPGSMALPRLHAGLAGLHALAGNRQAARRAVIQAHWLRRRAARDTF